MEVQANVCIPELSGGDLVHGTKRLWKMIRRKMRKGVGGCVRQGKKKLLRDKCKRNWGVPEGGKKKDFFGLGGRI